jgi:hypothetical protein
MRVYLSVKHLNTCLNINVRYSENVLKLNGTNQSNIQLINYIM